ncbi:MAG: hypothetical protein CMO80_08400 [Verrucomicrobiales bacterium]|nr:hypothetical protein [Verrucomicrobiales bacterium]|tara:strand:- start:24 stop:590 length:567 start_codon:yes stop_codon:yes gene_type:complete
MNSIFDKLGLRPGERRLVMFVLFVLFVVANYYVVWPYFKEWKVIQGQITELEATLKTYQEERDNLPSYQQTESDLLGQSPGLPKAGLGSTLLRDIENTAREFGQTFGGVKQRDAGDSDRSQFFEEKIVDITFTGWTDTNLLKALISLEEGNSVIRIQTLSIKPDVTRRKLGGRATLVASYQKADPTKQ